MAIPARTRTGRKNKNGFGNPRNKKINIRVTEEVFNKLELIKSEFHKEGFIIVSQADIIMNCINKEFDFYNLTLPSATPPSKQQSINFEP